MQKLRYSIYLKWLFVAGDLILMLLVLYAFYRSGFIEADGEAVGIYGLLLSFIWFFISGKTKIYDVPRNLTFTLYLERVILQVIFFLLSFYFLLKLGQEEYSYQQFWKMGLLYGAILFLFKCLGFVAVKTYRRRGHNVRNIMFLGKSDGSRVLEEILKVRGDYGYKLFPYPEEKLDMHQLQDFWVENGIYSVFIPMDHVFGERIYKEILSVAEDFGVSVSLVPNNLFYGQHKYEVEYYDIQPVLKLTGNPLESFSNYLGKRLFDLLFSLIVLLAFGIWVIPLIALLIKIDSRGPVFFKQKRYGYKNRIFKCWKFRTMVPNPEHDLRTTTLNDERITRVGRFLRRTSLDEFPQFINVLKGEMSVVGPRPHMIKVDQHYKGTIKKYNVRSSVRPGITGLAQIKGFRGEGKDMTFQMRKRIKADIFYVNNWSFTLDLIIILKTLYLLVSGDSKAY